MAKFIINTEIGYYRDFILNKFVGLRSDAHVFDDIVDAFDVMMALRNDGLEKVDLIEIDKGEMAELLELARQVVIEAEANAAANPSSREIQVVIVEPMKKPYKKTIPNDWEAMRNIVGGYIENVTIGTTASGARISIVVNEEGKLIGLPFNRRIMGKGGSDLLVGTFFITAYNLEGDNVSLSDAECEQYIRRFAALEIYL